LSSLPQLQEKEIHFLSGVGIYNGEKITVALGGKPHARAHAREKAISTDDWKVFVWFRPDPGSGKESQTPEENPYPFSSRLRRRDGYDNQDLPYKESKSVDLIHWGSLDAQPCVSCRLQDRGRIRKRCKRLLLSLGVGLRYWTAVPQKNLPPILGTSGLGRDPIMAFVPGSPPVLSSVFAPMAFKGHSLLTLFAHGSAGVLFSKSRFQKNVLFLRDGNKIFETICD
jgi:hypothetical protein